jgi:hypothetical protein
MGLSMYTATIGPLLLESVPSMPLMYAAVPSSSVDVALTWTAPADNGARPVFDYEVCTVLLGVSTCVRTGTNALSYSVTGLTNGDSYDISVAAVNSIGVGAAASATIVLIAVPSAVVNPRFVEAQYDNVTVAWDTPEDNGGQGILGYRLDYSTDVNFVNDVVSRLVPVQPRTFTFVPDIDVDSVDYHFRVRAVNSKGDGEQSAVQSATVQPQLSWAMPTASSLSMATVFATVLCALALQQLLL